MARVYVWPSGLGGSTLYTPPTRVRTTSQWDGAPGQKVEHVQRSRVELSGEVIRSNAPDFDIMLDRLHGGLHLVGLWDYELRLQNGWDAEPALNVSGAEFWRADGRTSLYDGEAANPPTGPWRSIFAKANGAAAEGTTSLAVDGLLDGEVIPKGNMIRTGDYRYRTLTKATANASGEATLSLAKELRAAVANNADVRIPGDLFVGSMIGAPELGSADVDGVRTFTLRFVEVYEDELGDTSVSPTPAFEWVVDT